MKTANKNKLAIFLSFALLVALVPAQAQQRGGNQSSGKQQTTNSKGSQKGSNTPGKVSRDQVNYKKNTSKVTAVRNLPTQSNQVSYKNTTYRVHNGRYYTNSGGKYIPVAPAVGLQINALPLGYVNILFGNRNYHYYDGIFYSSYNNGYQVISPEVGMIVEALPADYEKVEINGIVYYEYNNVLYQKVNTPNGKGYEVVGTIE